MGVSPPRQNSMAVQAFLHELLQDMDEEDDGVRVNVVFVDAANGQTMALVAGSLKLEITQ